MPGYRSADSFLIGLAAMGLVFSSPGVSQAQQPSQWQSTLLTDHVLVGRIWDQQAQQFISEEDLLATIGEHKFLLLGEKHDNPDHHAIQHRLLTQIFQQPSPALVSFEMLDSSQTSLLEQLTPQDLSTLEQLKSSLNWDVDGWNWNYYGPLIQTALSANSEVRAGNISQQEMRQVYSEPLPDSVAAVLSVAAAAALNEEIDVSHCGQLPESQFPAMVRVQQARDHRMATSLGEAAGAEQRVLVAGNFHIRQDLGVPVYLIASGAATDLDDVLTLAMLEVSGESENPADYIPGQGAQSAYDYVWFTPMVTDEDYCAAFL